MVRDSFAADQTSASPAVALCIVTSTPLPSEPKFCAAVSPARFRTKTGVPEVAPPDSPEAAAVVIPVMSPTPNPLSLLKPDRAMLPLVNLCWALAASVTMK